MVYINVLDYDKYGRILAEVRDVDSNLDVATWLLENKYAVKYNGGKKVVPSDWMNYINHRVEKF